MYIHGFLWDSSDFPCLSVSAHTPTLCMSCARLALCSRIWILTAPPIIDRPTSPSVLFAYHTNLSARCRWILRYSFSRASLLSFPFFFISLPPIPDALSIQLIPMCGYHSQSLCIQYKSFVFFLFRWYMISSSILSVVSNIKPSVCRLLHTEATIVLSATIYLFLVMVVFLGRVFNDARSLSLVWFLCLSRSFSVPSGWSIPLFPPPPLYDYPASSL